MKEIEELTINETITLQVDDEYMLIEIPGMIIKYKIKALKDDIKCMNYLMKN